MANRYNTSVQWALEPAVTFLSAHVTFGATGVPTVDAINSKGFANVWNQSIAFTGATSSGSSVITSVSSFAGLYTGMVISGSGVVGSPTIGTISAATGSVVLSAAPGAGSAFNATGGRYIFQFGLNNGNRLDSYFKLLYVHTSLDESSSSASGSIGVAALAPVAPSGGFIVQNNSRVRTIPSTQATASTDCSISLQFGAGTGTGFVARDPVAGEGIRVMFVFGNSSAI